MKDSCLIEPCQEYEKSFEEYVLAYKKVNDEYYFSKYKDALENFDEYLEDMHNNSTGINIPEGWVSTSTFWLIDNNEVVGVTRVRHQEAGSAGHIGYDISPFHRNRGYGTRILKLALRKAAEIGIESAVVTCSIDNMASKKVIENNNGELLGIVFDEEDNETLYKYRIPTTSI